MSCPICNDKPAPKYRPFCSRRCADVDLAKWMTGSYAMPSDDPEDIETAFEAAEHAARDQGTKPH